MEKYEIHIGSIYNIETGQTAPKQVMIISHEQFEVIKMFADQKKDSELKTIYKINNCEFTVYPHFEFQNLS